MDQHQYIMLSATTYTSIRAILESNRETDTTRQFTMKLTLGRTCSDRAPGDEVRDELRGDGIEQFGAYGDAEVRQVAE